MTTSCIVTCGRLQQTLNSWNKSTYHTEAWNWSTYKLNIIEACHYWALSLTAIVTNYLWLSLPVLTQWNWPIKAFQPPNVTKFIYWLCTNWCLTIYWIDSILRMLHHALHSNNMVGYGIIFSVICKNALLSFEGDNL